MNTSDVLRRLRDDLWQSPRPHGEQRRERTVGPLELFYDLVIVVIVAQAAHHLTEHMTPRGFGEFLAVFGVVWLAWFNGTSLHELHGREDVRSRNIFLAQVLFLVPLGAFISGAGGEHGQAFATTAALLFGFLAFQWWRVRQTDTAEYGRATGSYVALTLGLAVGIGASAPLSADSRLIAWAVLAVAYIAGVAFAFAQIPGRFEDTFAITESLNERFGLLVIIVLGETVTGVVTGLSDDPTGSRTLAVGVICVVVGFGAWWTYFDFVGHRSPGADRGRTYTWLLAHLPVTAAIAGMGAAMPVLIEHSAEHRASVASTWVMCAGAATVLLFTVVLMATLCDWAAESALFRPLSVANLIAAGVAVALGAIRPSPLVLCILLVATFSGPWIFAVLRRAALEVADEGSTSGVVSA